MELLAVLLLAAQDLKPMQEACTQGHFLAVVRLFEEGADELRKHPEALYMAGHAWMRLHKPETAKKHLIAAAEGGFRGYPRWETVDSYLRRIETVEQHRPPVLRELAGADGKVLIRVYAKESAWTRPIVNALPEFLKRGRELLGDDLPPIDFYFIRPHDDYRAFYKAILGVDIPTSWQNGTGNANLVTFQELDAKGRPTGGDRLLGDVLHEYGHALLNTHYGDRYLARVPQWMDEGFADAFARPFYAELFRQSPGYVRAHLARNEAPTFEQLSKNLYEKDPVVRYSLARLTVQEILKDQPLTAIRKVLDLARPDGAFESAIEKATGVPPRAAYEKVLDAHRSSR